MKNLDYLVSKPHEFILDEHLFRITREDLVKLARMGELVNKFLIATTEVQDGFLLKSLSATLNETYLEAGTTHLHIPPRLVRVDVMADKDGNWKIAEIDPSNKHGLGFALACRNESGAGERQKLLTLLAQYVTDDVHIFLGRKESFYAREKKYFAQKLTEFTGRRVKVFSEEQLEAQKFPENGIFLDFPLCGEKASRMLLSRWKERPDSFINPPRHGLGSKAVMALPFLDQYLFKNYGSMSSEELDELKKFIPPTYNGPFVTKEVFSSGAKGVYFDAIGKETVVQKYVKQKTFPLADADRFIRLAVHLVNGKLAELTVTASKNLPVHGGNGVVNYHVGLKEDIG